MNVKEFTKFYKKNEIHISHREGEHKITFLKLFTEIFPNLDVYDLDIDEYIGFIFFMDYYYIGESFLKFCKEKGLKDDEALRFYDHSVDIHTRLDIKDSISDEEAYKTFLKFNQIHHANLTRKN